MDTHTVYMPAKGRTLDDAIREARRFIPDGPLSVRGPIDDPDDAPFYVVTADDAPAPVSWSAAAVVSVAE